MYVKANVSPHSILVYIVYYYVPQRSVAHVKFMGMRIDCHENAN